MDIEYHPLINIFDLEETLQKRYQEKFNDIYEILFDDYIQNDTIKRWYIEKPEEFESHVRYEWTPLEDWEKLQKIKRFLYETLPNEEQILIDVSW